MAHQQEMLSIDDISRDTGLGKDQLRAWERRYGFPQPVRDEHGQRRYSRQQLACLREVSRLVDQGHRPGQLLHPALCESLLTQQATAPAGEDSQPQVRHWLDMDHERLARLLGDKIATLPLRDAISQVIEPLMQAVGDRWADGSLPLFEEHRLSQLLGSLLAHRLLQLEASADMPRVLFCTLPGERHQLGLLLAELRMREQGCRSINLGPEMPLDELVAAARAYRADSIALSFSSAMSRRRIISALGSLLELCPDRVSIIAGGAGIANLRRLPERVSVVRHPRDLDRLLKQWRKGR